MTDVEKLQERVANGLTWLAEHDPDGRFHLWWVARLSPSGPMPAHEATPEVRVAYTEYTRQRNLWEQLSEALAKVDPDWRDTPPVLGSVTQWKGDPSRIRTR